MSYYRNNIIPAGFAPPSDAELRFLVERRQRAYLWGRPRMVTPLLIDEVFGDGRQLLALAPIMSRPNFYAVRIGSDWNTSNRRHGIVDLCDRLGSIYQSIEEQFDIGTDEDEEPFEGWRWPQSFDGGSEWFSLDWPIDFQERRRRSEQIRFFRRTA